MTAKSVKKKLDSSNNSKSTVNLKKTAHQINLRKKITEPAVVSKKNSILKNSAPKKASIVSVKSASKSSERNQLLTSSNVSMKNTKKTLEKKHLSKEKVAVSKKESRPIEKIVANNDKKTLKKEPKKVGKSVNISAGKSEKTELKKSASNKKSATKSKRSATPKPISESHETIKIEISALKKDSARYSDVGQVRSKLSKNHRIRPSESISFSLEDLDTYLERRSAGAQITSFKEKPSVKSKKTVSPKPAAVKTPPLKPQSTARNPIAPASIFDILGFNPVEAPSREKLEEKDVPRKWKKYYNALIELRKHHSTGIETRSEEVLKRSAKEDSGDLSSYGQHLADAGSESFERDMAYNILSTEKEYLAEIDAAIKRIKNGTYGICEVTGVPIPEERLTAIPFTRYTKEGQEKKELELKRIRSSQRSMFDIPETATGASEEDASF